MKERRIKSGIPGSLFVRRNGSRTKGKIWYKVYVQGVSRSMSTGVTPETEKSWKLAEQIAEKKYGELIGLRGAAKTMTISEAYEYWKKHALHDIMPTTLRNYEKQVRTVFGSHWSNTFINDEVSVKESISDYMINSDNAPRTKNAKLGVTRSFFQFLLEEELVRKNPVSLRYRSKKVRKKTIEIWTPEEYEAIVFHLATQDHKSKKTNALWRELSYLVQLMFLQGFRIEEARQLQKDARVIRDGRECLLIPSKDRSRIDTVYISQKTRNILDRLDGANPGAYYFQCQSMNYNWIRRSHDRVLRELEIPKSTSRDSGGYGRCFHTYRKTFGSMLARIITNPKVLQKLMRHESLDTTLSYYVEADKQDMIAAIDEFEQNVWLKV